MVGVQLGWLADALNWLFKKVLNPVFDWLSNLLSTVFSWVFNNILQPVLEFVFETFLADILHAILHQICLRLLGIMDILLMIVDAITSLFRIFAGLSPVTMIYKDGNENAIEVTGNLLLCIYQTPFVRGAIFALMGIGFALCFLFALIAVIRSVLDFDGKEGKPVSHVLRMTASAFLKLIIAPLFGIFMILLSSAILQSIDKAFSGSGEEFSISRTIFVITTFDAVDVKKNKNRKGQNICGQSYPATPSDYNSSTGHSASFTDPYRKPFYVAGGDYKVEDLMYNLVEIEKTFDIVKINYLQGYLLALAFILMLLASLLIFLCRIFDVILLLIMGPLFVAPMPFDDGEHYEKWQELFIGKLFGGYGMVIAMNTYLIVSAALFNGGFMLVKPGNGFSVLEDALIKLVFMIGGVFAVLNIGPLVTSILSQTAANDEMQQGAVLTGALSSAISNPGKLQQQLRGMAKGKIKGALSGKGQQGKVKDSAQKFDSSRAPKQGRGSVAGIAGGAARGYAMGTMMATPEKTMRKKEREKFSDGTYVDDVMNEPAKSKPTSQAFAGAKPSDTPAEKPSDKPADKPSDKPADKSATTGPGADPTMDKALQGTLGGTDKPGGTDKSGGFDGQSSSQAARGSDLGVGPATTTTKTTSSSGGTTVTKTTTTQSTSSQPSLEQELGIDASPPPPAAAPSGSDTLDASFLNDLDPNTPLPSASGLFEDPSLLGSAIPNDDSDPKKGKF